MKLEPEVRMIDIDKIRPNPFQPRETFPKEEIQDLANTVKKVGLLQPISVRKKGNTYQIISGERRWRASQFAGLKKMPVIIKDIDDAQLMIESLIENVHRKDLEPLERARGLAEVYKGVGFEPTEAATKLHMVSRKLEAPKEYPGGLTEEEKRIKEVGDMVGLSFDYQYRLLTQLRLTGREQSRVAKLGLGYEATSSIATIEDTGIRQKVIEVVPELKRAEVKKLVKVVKKAPEPIIEEVLKPKSKITPVIAERLVDLSEKKQKEAMKQIKSLRLDEDEAISQIEAMRAEVPLPPPEQFKEIKERYEELQQEIKAKLDTPEAKERGRLFRNWTTHIAIAGVLGSAVCPKCGSHELGWICHKFEIKEALRQAEKLYKDKISTQQKK